MSVRARFEMVVLFVYSLIDTPRRVRDDFVTVRTRDKCVRSGNFSRQYSRPAAIPTFRSLVELAPFRARKRASRPDCRHLAL